MLGQLQQHRRKLARRELQSRCVDWIHHIFAGPRNFCVKLGLSNLALICVIYFTRCFHDIIEESGNSRQSYASCGPYKLSCSQCILFDEEASSKLPIQWRRSMTAKLPAYLKPDAAFGSHSHSEPIIALVAGITQPLDDLFKVAETSCSRLVRKKQRQW